MKLLIDTTVYGHISLALIEGEKFKRKEIKTEKISEVLLLEIQKFLKASKASLRDLDMIAVNPGPGGFSSTRTGVAVANALAYALEIPVAEWPSGKIKDMILPRYDKEPNITKSHKLSS